MRKFNSIDGGLRAGSSSALFRGKTMAFCWLSDVPGGIAKQCIGAGKAALSPVIIGEK